MIFTGANVENAAYPLSSCAERVAVGQAVSAGYRNILAIAVAGPPDASSAPCGGCRQILSEFGSGIAVTYTTPAGPRATTIEHLLPESFGPGSLQRR
ncbi:MAG: hypothetical protein NVS9B12_15680 [Vulcanimicrobiaceae bacterium]